MESAAMAFMTTLNIAVNGQVILLDQYLVMTVPEYVVDSSSDC